MNPVVLFSTLLVSYWSGVHGIFPNKGLCKDQLSSYMCRYLQKHRACKLNPIKMAVFCPKTCGYCAPKSKLSCNKMNCPSTTVCVKNKHGKAECRCLIECKKNYGTGVVCGNNGKTYPDLCDLINDQCHKEDFIMVRNYGPCRKPVQCKDNDREAKLGLCKEWRDKNACFEHSGLMRNYCPKTCGFCRQPIEPKCKRSKYGCCWNARGDVAAKGKYGAGCGSCKDLKFCQYFRKACGGVGKANKLFMKKMCPETCCYCRKENKST